MGAVRLRETCLDNPRTSCSQDSTIRTRLGRREGHCRFEVVLLIRQSVITMPLVP